MAHGRIQHPEKSNIVFSWIKPKGKRLKGWIEEDGNIVRGSIKYYLTFTPEQAAQRRFFGLAKPNKLEK